MSVPSKQKHTLQHHRKPARPKGVRHAEFHKVYWPYLPLLVLAVTGIIFSSFNAAASRSLHLPHGKVLSYATTMSISGLLSATNSSRAANGAADLTINSKLNAAAQNKANDMATRNYWSHNTPEGNPPWVFVDAQGYSYLKIGENLAAGFTNEQATINGWMNSPGHRANMLDTDFRDVGFGFANNANYTAAGGGPMTIVVAFYGKPSSSAPTAPAACPAGQTGTPPNCSTPAVPQTNSSSTSHSASTPPGADTKTTQTTPTPSATGTGQPDASAAVPVTTKQDTVTAAEPKAADTAPVTTASDAGYEPATKETSVVSSKFADPTAGALAAAATAAAFVGAAGIWASRHLLRVRRMLVRGEGYVLHHPVIDVVLLTIIAVAYTLTQTSGLIK